MNAIPVRVRTGREYVDEGDKLALHSCAVTSQAKGRQGQQQTQVVRHIIGRAAVLNLQRRLAYNRVETHKTYLVKREDLPHMLPHRDPPRRSLSSMTPCLRG